MKDRKFFFRNSPAIAGLFVVALAQAEVPVVESNPVGDSGQSSSVASSAPSSAGISQAPAGAGNNLFYQLDMMQQEIQTLRGMLEEQGHALRMMKQEQRDRYIDLDRRISQVNSGSVPPEKGDSTVSASSPEADSKDQSLEKQSYADAFKLIKARKFDEAVAALNAFLAEYPDGYYTGNARYWLGEVYLAVSNPEMAKEVFQRVLADYPKHRKAPDAGYKLGRVFVMLGDKVKAKESFEMTISQYPGTPAARLSEEALKQL